MNPHALSVLEFDQALALVARPAASALGAAAVRALEPSANRRWIETELRRVAEGAAYLGRNSTWAMQPFPDVRGTLGRLAVEGSVFEADALRDLRLLLGASRAAREAILESDDDAPLLAAVAGGMAALPREAERIDRAITEGGEVRDDASPELARLRREIRSVRSRIVDKLTAYAATLPSQYQVSDASVSVRDGRYVVPVRREGRNEVGGIVHGESGSGATLFVEPPLAIEMMNRLREREAGEVREVLRILRELTVMLRPHQPELLETLERLVELDSIIARARFALDTGAACPALVDAGSGGYRVVQGRHPILLAREETVVPFDLEMEGGERTLLISGPNTGGKTVLLKAMGLLSLLAQSGVIPPVGSGTRLPVFHDFYADIGDEQSIEASLSTFSAHLANIRVTLAEADGRSLVLIDEIGSGTDPTEGGALARAVLLELTRRSSFTVATTHLGQLKLLASEERGIVNASLQFDSERLQPTYRLLKGMPGRSYGLAIARRLGLPAALLEEAEAALPKGERDVAKLLLELEAKEQRVADAEATLAAQLAETERLAERLDVRERQLRQRETDSERRARQQARDLLLKARGEVEAAIEEVRGAAGAEALAEAARAARRRVEEEARRQRERKPERKAATSSRESPRASPLKEGMRVRIESIGQTGTIAELRDGRATVEAGNLRLQLATADLTPLPEGDQESAPHSKPTNGGYVAATIEASSEVDLRGMRVDEIELLLGRALDAALMSSLPTFRIIHGKGTGALRDRVEQLLERDQRVTTFRPGERFEGGTGVTVAEFG